MLRKRVLSTPTVAQKSLNCRSKQPLQTVGCLEGPFPQQRSKEMGSRAGAKATAAPPPSAGASGPRCLMPRPQLFFPSSCSSGTPARPTEEAEAEAGRWKEAWAGQAGELRQWPAVGRRPGERPSPSLGQELLLQKPSSYSELSRSCAPHLAPGNLDKPEESCQAMFLPRAKTFD